jgi:hypothetical protein
MDYELARELKEAGYPLSLDDWGLEGYYHPPNLSELIEACGGVLLWGCKPHGYYASKQFCPVEHPNMESVIEADAEGATPEEAVARLWVALNEKARPPKRTLKGREEDARRHP